MTLTHLASLALFVAALAAGSTPVAAQTVVGTVVDRASRLPIAGAVVQRLGPGGAEHCRGLTDARGAFALRARADVATNVPVRFATP